MFERPILLYSNYCAYSQQFVEMLLENKELFETFIRVNIDANPDTKRRPDLFYQIQDTLNYKIKEVPTSTVISLNKSIVGAILSMILKQQTLTQHGMPWKA